MPAYTVAATAVTLGMPAKWVDNVLSHYQVRGVSQTRQGVARRLAPQAILILEVAARISRALAIPVGRAIEMAEGLAAEPEAELVVGEGITLSIDLASIRAELQERLANAVEVAPSPRRGRPRGP